MCEEFLHRYPEGSRTEEVEGLREQVLEHAREQNAAVLGGVGELEGADAEVVEVWLEEARTLQASMGIAGYLDAAAAIFISASATDVEKAKVKAAVAAAVLEGADFDAGAYGETVPEDSREQLGEAVEAYREIWKTFALRPMIDDLEKVIAEHTAPVEEGDGE